MTRLFDSIDRCREVLEAGNLRSDEVVSGLIRESAARRALDLSDLPVPIQARLLADRAVDVLPSLEGLSERIERARSEDRQFVVKFGIDPTAADVHLGHAVPMILASRLQRMGHRVVFIVGDVTAFIGDPSGRSGDRPDLTEDEIAENLRTYRDQVAPFFDFDRADFRRNSDWLGDITLPALLKILARIPVSASLQREDFRNRLQEGHGLAMSEFLYSVVMALDSVAAKCDLEIGGLDQLLNMHMCRRVMEIAGQMPELVMVTRLLEGTDGSGAKMSKSKGNYIALSSAPGEIYGQMMSIPDRLTVDYLRALTEWSEPEIETIMARQERRSIHPMDLKRLLAGDVVAAIHGVDAARAARAEFEARFSRRKLSDIESVPELELASVGGDRLGGVLTQTLGLTPSMSVARRIADQKGLRIVIEALSGAQDTVVLSPEDVGQPVGDVIASALKGHPLNDDARVYIKVGRHVVHVSL